MFDDSVVISNPGGLPDDLTVEDLRGPNRSHPRNPLLAQVFYYASIVERWGSGTTRMAQLCHAQGLPEPEFASTPHTFTVTFRKDAYTPERLKKFGLNDRQMQALLYVKNQGSISNRDFRNLFSVSHELAHNELHSLVQMGLIHTEGRGRSLRYMLGKPGPKTES